MKFMQLRPQKARGHFQESMWSDPAWSAEVKYDGDRRIAQFVGGAVRLTGTRESVDGTGFVEKSKNLPQLQSSVLNRGVYDSLNGTVLDGEIVAPWAADLPGGESKWVTSIMGSSPERAVALQRERGWLEYMVFDCLWYCGQYVGDQSLQARRVYVNAALKKWNNQHAFQVVHDERSHGKKSMWESAREGLVFKHREHTYGDERLWVKLKKEWTADVVCMGFEPGRGKYAGSVGAIIFGQYRSPIGSSHPVRMGTCRGFSDNQMDSMTKNPKRYLGRVFELIHNGREPTGAFRHPRFKRWRDDKDQRDCVYREGET